MWEFKSILYKIRLISPRIKNSMYIILIQWLLNFLARGTLHKRIDPEKTESLKYFVFSIQFYSLLIRVSKNTEIGIGIGSHENNEIPIGISVFIGSFQIMKESFDGVSPN